MREEAQVTGLLTGAVAGLATITPCAGFVTANNCGDHRSRLHGEDAYDNDLGHPSV